MIQLQILSGKQAGTTIVARRFPFSVGRSSSNDLVITDAGVFEKHFQIDLGDTDDFSITTIENTFVAVSGEQNVRDKALRNGDIIDIGEVKLRFAISPTQQRSLVPREMSTWIGLILLTIAQIALIAWLR